MVGRCLLLCLLGLTVLHAGRAQNAPHLYPIVEGGKLGFIDSSGKEIIPPRFEGHVCFVHTLPQFSEGLAPVYFDPGVEKWGYIDTTGKFVFLLPPHFNYPASILEGVFHEGVAPVRISLPSNGVLERLLAWIDRTGRVLHSELTGSGTEFHEGLLKFQSLQLWGYVDHSFQWVIPPQFHTAEDISEGVALVTTADSQTNWAFVDKTGMIVFKDKNNGKYMYSYARSFSDGLAHIDVVGNDSHSYVEFVDHTGQVVVGPTLATLRDFHEGYAFASTGPEGLAIIDKRGKQNPLSGFGQNTLNSQFHEGLAAANKADLYGYIGYDGGWIISPQFERAGNFSDGVAQVDFDWLQKREWGYIDKRGQVIWKGVDQCQYPPF